jgi:hypothetical protein
MFIVVSSVISGFCIWVIKFNTYINLYKIYNNICFSHCTNYFFSLFLWVCKLVWHTERANEAESILELGAEDVI